MLWFRHTPWGRWAIVLLVAAVSLYVEFRPDPTVAQPFATTVILPGDTIDGTNTEMRDVPAGLLEPATRGDTATRTISPDAPVLATDTRSDTLSIPSGWWVVQVPLPAGTHTGDRVRMVLIESGADVDGVVAYPGSDDPFSTVEGGVAVPPERSSEVAIAAASERIAVLVSTG